MILDKKIKVEKNELNKKYTNPFFMDFNKEKYYDLHFIQKIYLNRKL